MTTSVKEQIDVAAAFVRLYVFLAQYLDRCLNDTAPQNVSDAELRGHLTDTRSQLLEILAVNPVVRNKLAQECDRILALGNDCLKTGTPDAQTRNAILAERAILTNKTIVLSDLVAVFRAMS